MRSVAEPTYSFVIPIYNEEDALPELARRLDALLEQMDGRSEVMLVDDGSRDGSWSLIADIVANDQRFKAIGFSRNFGHQMAITAGMDRAAGEAVIVMDADLQDPPEVVLELIARWKEGFDVVYARRLSREGDNAFKRATASLFYRLLAQISSIDIPRDVGDFRLIDRKVL